jgi:hypothetical protein
MGAMDGRLSWLLGSLAVRWPLSARHNHQKLFRRSWLRRIVWLVQQVLRLRGGAKKEEIVKASKWWKELERPIAIADDSLTIVPWSSRGLLDAML